MPAELFGNIIAIVIAIGLLLSLRLPRLPKHWLYGIILTIIGGVRLLNYYDVIPYTIPDMPIMAYILQMVVMVAGGSLILDSFKEQSIIKLLTFSLGVLIATLAIAPTLYDLNIITFKIPSYPEFINDYLYVLGGFFLFLATVIIKEGNLGQSNFKKLGAKSVFGKNWDNTIK